MNEEKEEVGVRNEKVKKGKGEGVLKISEDK